MDSSAYPQSRNEAFAQGNGSGPVHPISSLQNNVDPMFHPAGVLSSYENIPSGVGQDPRVTGMTNTKQYGITGKGMGGGSNQGSETMNV